MHALSIASLALFSAAAYGPSVPSPTPTSSAGSSGALWSPQGDSLTPDAKNLATWADFIRPNADELKYESIGWRNAFWPAVQEARKLGRPILLWTMNGHPLGCT